MSGWLERRAPAKVNLALVVGPVRGDGKHEVVTVLERLTLADTVAVRRAAATAVSGFADDSLVRRALDALAHAAEGTPRFEARLEKQIPVAAGLGGGSTDAAAALVLGNELLDTPLERDVLVSLAARLGADVPFFLYPGPQLATGDGTTLAPLSLPRDYVVLLALPEGASKSSTGGVYSAFDHRRGDVGFEARRMRLLDALRAVRAAGDLAALPPNDLASTPLSDDLRALGAFRADVTGAGPVVYALFEDGASAEHARAALVERRAQTWIAAPG